MTQTGVPYLTYDTFIYRRTEILVTGNADGGGSGKLGLNGLKPEASNI